MDPSEVSKREEIAKQIKAKLEEFIIEYNKMKEYPPRVSISDNRFGHEITVLFPINKLHLYTLKQSINDFLENEGWSYSKNYYIHLNTDLLKINFFFDLEDLEKISEEEKRNELAATKKEFRGFREWIFQNL